MDVGVVATHFPPAKGYGGVSTTAGVLSRAWAEKGYRQTLVVSDESIGGRLNNETVFVNNLIDIGLYKCYWFRRWGFGLGAIPKIWRLCVQAPVVYVHGIATWPSTLAAGFCGLLKKPFMVAVHGGLMPEHVALIRRKKPLKWLFYRFLTFPSLRRAIAVHCTSVTEAEGVRAVLADQARIVLIPNGIDYQDYQVANYPTEIGVQLCFLGHIQPEKGINAFIKIWLKNRNPADRLVVAGTSADDDYFSEFLSLLAQSEGAIRYLGYLQTDEVKNLLAASHYLILPSGLEEEGGMRENFGNVVAESLAAGRPVLVTRGLAWDHLPSYGAGLVFERDENSVMEVLRKINNIEQAEWEMMSNYGRAYVEQNLHPIKLAEKIWQVLNNPDQPGDFFYRLKETAV